MALKISDQVALKSFGDLALHEDLSLLCNAVYSEIKAQFLLQCV